MFEQAIELEKKEGSWFAPVLIILMLVDSLSRFRHCHLPEQANAQTEEATGQSKPS